MADNETIADIIAEMRGMGNYQRYSGAHARVLANRLDAAHKRERGDAAKLREVLETLRELLGDLLRLGDAEYHNDFSNFCDIIDAALAAPPRNCDVGSAEEQSRRFDQVCSFRFTGNCAGCKNPLDDSAANGVSDCALFWAQMPYDKEGGAK